MWSSLGLLFFLIHAGRSAYAANDGDSVINDEYKAMLEAGAMDDKDQFPHYGDGDKDPEESTGLLDQAHIGEENTFLLHILFKLAKLEVDNQAQDIFLSARFPEYRVKMDGGWSVYGPWSPCSKQCDGVTVRFRTCFSPPPMNGGKLCEGDDHEVKACNTDCGGEKVSPSHLLGTIIRLKGGKRASEGRVEVYDSRTGQWGTVCDRRFQISDAVVICTMLGYPGPPEIINGGHFGEGSGPILFDKLHCTGIEKDLFHCPGSGSEISSKCRHKDDVSVDCEPGLQEKNDSKKEKNITGVRLIGLSSATKGLVQVQLDGRWGTVCDDHFQTKDAIVTCKMLGVFNGATPRLMRVEVPPTDVGPILLDDMECKGHEDSLQQCRHRLIGRHRCHHYEDVAIDCQPGSATQCPDDWTQSNGTCYLLFSEKVDYATAQDVCRNRSSSLVEVKSKDESNVITDIIKTDGSVEKVWLALVRQSGTVFVWASDSSIPVYVDWVSGEPDPELRKDCVVIHPSGMWRQHSCRADASFICQMPPN